MAQHSIITSLRSFLGREEEVHYERFRDGLGNFEIFYPRGWKFDENIAVMDGRYSITFESPDRLSEFTVAIDIQIPMDFDFHSYARSELESPESGIYTPVKEGSFNNMPAFLREYAYSTGGRTFFGGGVMFFTGKIVFSLSWSGPKKKEPAILAIFDHMRKTIIVRESFTISKKKLPGSGSIEISPRKTKRRKSS